ncbi:MAG: SsrA-binding protein SmpB [Planctomycetota bacterium]
MSKPDPKSQPGISLILRNKKAFHEFEILETLECGIALTGTEVKSLRERKVNFSQTFALAKGGRLTLIGLHIAPYAMGNLQNHPPERKRPLLAHRREIRKLARRTDERGLSLVPLKLYWKRGRCKVELAVVRGKHLHDKREIKREKDLKRQVERETRSR